MPRDPKEIARVIAETASVELQDKFIRGQHEHGGNFDVKPTVRNIREETLDLINYTHMLIQHRSQTLQCIDKLVEELPTLESSVITIRLKYLRQLIHDL
jgi:hypothetical protein